MSVSSIAAQGWSRWTAALAALVLVVTAVAAGARYVVCARTGTTHSHACCAQRHAKASRRPIEPARFVPVRSCCEPRVVPASGASAIEHSPPAIEPGGAVLAQLAWAAGSWLAADSTPQAEHWPIRAGPLGPAERRAWLQVFLI